MSKRWLDCIKGFLSCCFVGVAGRIGLLFWGHLETVRTIVFQVPNCKPILLNVP